MTNLDRWKLYNRDSFAPDLFIEWGWYSMIGAALQRRVWYDNSQHPLYTNQYIILVGPPGTGKGLVTDNVKMFLQHNRSTTDSTRADEAAAALLSGIKPKKPLMFHCAADSTTFESLLQDTVMASVIDKIGGREVMHASLFMCLDELTSIFKKNSEELLAYLLTAWGCKDYERTTKRSGNNSIINPCLNLLAGTTPDEFCKLGRQDIIGSGFSARLMLVYASMNRSRGIKIPAPDPEQSAARDHIYGYLRQLRYLYQCCKYTPEAETVLEDWWRNESRVRVNTNPRLDEYYVRKLTHAHKLIMIMHYSDPGYSEPVPVATIHRAIEALERVEKYMHMALSVGGRNELEPIARKIATFITRWKDGCTFVGVVQQFYSDATPDEIKNILEALQMQGVVQFNSITKRYNSCKPV